MENDVPTKRHQWFSVTVLRKNLAEQNQNKCLVSLHVQISFEGCEGPQATLGVTVYRRNSEKELQNTSIQCVIINKGTFTGFGLKFEMAAMATRKLFYGDVVPLLAS
jgi:hypothetical protein